MSYQCPGSGLTASIRHYEDRVGHCRVCGAQVDVTNYVAGIHESDIDRLPQPHEDIQGVDRSGSWLLALGEPAVAHRDALIALAMHLYQAVLVGNPAPRVARMYKRISCPQVGDLVVVRDGVRGDVERRSKSLGFLVANRVEWGQTDDEWEAELAGGDVDASERGVEPDAWYVQYGSAPVDVCRWTNCSLITVPVDNRMFDHPVGARDADGSVTLTRDDVLDGLADAGFSLS